MSSPLRSIRSARSNKTQASNEQNLSEIQHPQKVRVLILTEQKLVFQEYYYLKNFINIIKLDLSYNKIIQFPQGFSFKNFSSLKSLFLHYNKFDKLKNLELLADCKVLVYFTLFGNPLEETLARHFCVNIMPWLKLMDDKPVKEEQKYSGLLSISLQNKVNERVGFPLIQVAQKQNSIQFLGNVMRQIKIARDYYLKVNPIIVIQKWWKHLYKRQNLYPQFIKQTQIKSKGNAEQKENTNKPNLINFPAQTVVVVEPKNPNVTQNEKQKQEETQKVQFKQESIKIVNLFKVLTAGMHSLELLLEKNQSLFCDKQFCELNGLKYKQERKYKNKCLVFYKIPLSHRNYDIMQEKQRVFVPLIFYNNSHYSVQLKQHNSYVQTYQLEKSQLKNISDGKRTSVNLFNNFDLVQIDASKQEKIQIIKREYSKSRIKNFVSPFPFLFGMNLVKICSAIKIQKHWRGFSVRKQLNAMKKVKEKFAAMKIQKWLRKLKFNHRQRFLINSYQFLRKNDSSNILMKLQTFCRIHNIYERTLSRGNYLKLPFQDCDFEIIQNQKDKNKLEGNVQPQLTLNASKITIKVKINASRQPFPSYFKNFIEDFELDQNIKEEDNGFELKKLKIFDLLIKGSKSINKIFMSGPKDKQKYEYVKFQYHSRQNANSRKLLLSLLIYRFKTKKQVQFYSQKQPRMQIKSNDMLEKIKETFFVKMIYDNNKKEKLFQKIQNYTEQIQKISQVSWVPLKIRFFDSTIDYSSIFIIGKYKNQFKSQAECQQNSERQNKLNTFASRKRLKQLNSLKTLQNKIVLKNLDTYVLSPLKSKINNDKSFMSFSICVDKDFTPQIQTKRYNEYRKQKYFHSLHSNQSQMSLDWNEDSGLDNSLNSYGSTAPLRKSNLQESIDFYQKSILSISEKKQLIQKIKSSHKYKLEMLNEIKKRKLEDMQIQSKSNADENMRLIRQSSNSSLKHKTSKVHKIKQFQKYRSSTNDQLKSFQNKFLRKGNLSIQHEMKQFQKSRSRSKNHDNYESSQNGIRKSARYQQADSQKESKIHLARQYLKRNSKKNILKTQLKEFSIQLSEGIDLATSFPDNETSHSELNHLLKQHKLSKQLKTNLKREALNSATSQKISKLYEQKKKQFLKSEPKHELQNRSSKDNLIEKSFVVVNSQSNMEQINQHKSGNIIENEKKKQMRKKKVVHSVFPEEFFPLKDSQQIGFHLPRINTNKEKH